MGVQISLWNMHRWFEEQGVKHEVRISDHQACIRGIRFEYEGPDAGEYAIICDTRLIGGFDNYSVVICQGDNYLMFQDVSADIILNQANCMMTAYKKWEKTLKRINIENKGIKEMLEATEEIFHFPIMLVKDGDLFACSPGYKDEIRECWERYQNCTFERIAEQDGRYEMIWETYSKNRAVMTRLPYFSKGGCIVGNVWVKGNCVLKILAFDRADEFSEGDIHLIDELTRAVHINVCQNMEKYFPENEPEIVFREAVQDSGADKGKIDVSLRKTGWNREDRYFVYVLESGKCLSYFGIQKLIRNIRKRISGGCVFQVENSIVVVLNRSRCAEKQEEPWLWDCAVSEELFLGKSCEGRDFYLLAYYYRQAQELSEKARFIGKNCLTGEEMRTAFIYSMVDSNQWYQSLVLPEIRILEYEDERRGGQWCRTLYAFLNSGCNSVAAAKSLGIHRSTLNYRLEQIRGMIGDKFDSNQGRERLMLSLLVSWKKSRRQSETPGSKIK